MTETCKRLFIAIPVVPPSSLIQTVGALRKKFSGSRIKWVSPKNWHLTLHFLGDTPVSMVERVTNIMEEALVSFSPFEAQLKGLGIFKNHRHPRVVWCGCEPEDILTGMYTALSPVYALVKKESPGPEFHPHLTIGRIKWIENQKDLASYVEERSETVFSSFAVSEIHLIESHLRPEGPEYQLLFSKKL